MSKYNKPKITIDLNEYNDLIKGNTEKINMECLLNFIVCLINNQTSEKLLDSCMTQAGYEIIYKTEYNTIKLGNGKIKINLGL